MLPTLKGASALVLAVFTASGIIMPAGKIPGQSPEEIRFDKSEQRIDQDAEFARDHVLVMTSLGTSSDLITSQGSISDTDLLFETDRYSVISAKLEQGYTPEEALEDLNEEDFVIYAEPDYCIDVSNGSNGTYSLDSGYQWHHKAIHTYEAWRQLDNLPSARRTRVAVIDGMFQLQHDDIWTSVNMVYSADFSTGKKRGVDWYSPRTDHANYCAGVIAARSTDKNGIDGVASGTRNNLSDLVCLSVYKGELSGTDLNPETHISALASAITYAADVNCKVVSISVGLASNDTSRFKVIEAAVDYAYNKGTLCVVASGNTGKTVNEYPAALSKVITVGNLRVDQNGKLVREYTSSYGNIDISAPGTNILTINSHGSSSVVTGTSFAAPMVAGALSLIMSVDPKITASEAYDILISTAVDVGTAGYDQYTGYGCIDCYAAVKKAVEKYNPKYVLNINISDDGLEETLDQDDPITSSLLRLFINEALAIGTSDSTQINTGDYVDGRISLCDHFDRVFRSSNLWKKQSSMTDDELIKMIYKAVLGTEPTSDELAQGRSQIKNYSRAHMIGKFMRLSSTQDAIRKTYPRVKSGDFRDRKYFWNIYC